MPSPPLKKILRTLKVQIERDRRIFVRSPLSLHHRSTFPAFSHDSWCMELHRRFDDTLRAVCVAIRYLSLHLCNPRFIADDYARMEVHAAGGGGGDGPSPSAIERPLSIDVVATSFSMYPTYRCQTRCSTCSLKRGEARTVAILAPVY